MRLIACKFIIKFERYCTFILEIDISLFDFSILFLPFQIVGLLLYIFSLPPRKRSVFFFVIKMFLDSGICVWFFAIVSFEFCLFVYLFASGFAWLVYRWLGCIFPLPFYQFIAWQC